MPRLSIARKSARTTLPILKKHAKRPLIGALLILNINARTMLLITLPIARSY